MAQLYVEIGAKVGEFQKALNRIERRVNRFSRNMERLGTNLTQSVTLPLVGLGAASVSAFAGFERLEKGLIAVMGSADAAAAEMERLKQSAQLPGLGFEEAVRGSIRLQAVGLSADEARRTLETFGTAIAATGGNARNLDSVQYQLTQMISKNRILQEDFGILQENVPLIGKALEAAFGTANIENIRDSGISAQEFNRRLVDALGNLDELRGVTGGVGNALDNFRDSLRFSLVELGRTISETINLSGVLDDLSNFISRAVEGFKSLSPETQRLILIVAAAAVAVGPLLLALGKLASIIPALTTAIGAISGAFAFFITPVGLAVAAVGALVAAFIEARINSDRWARSQAAANGTLFETNRATKALADVNAQASKEIAGQVAVVENLVRIAQDESAATTVRTDALKKLKAEYPEYFGQISEDLSQTDSLTAAKNRLTESLLRQAQAQAATARITELETEKLDIQEQVGAEQAKQQEILNKLREQGFGSIQEAVQKSIQNRELIAQQAAGTRGVNTQLLNQSKNLAELVGQYQAAGSVIDNANRSLNDLSSTQQKLAEQAAQGVIVVPTSQAADTADAVVIPSQIDESEGKKNAEKYVLPLNLAIAKLIRENPITRLFEDSEDAAKGLAQQTQAALAPLAAFEPTGLQRLNKEIKQASDSIIALGGGPLEVMQEQAAILRQRIAELAAQFGAASPQVQALQEQLAPLETQLAGIALISESLGPAFDSFFSTILDGGRDAFGALVDSIKKFVKELAVAIASAAALAFIVSLIFPAAGGFGSVFKLFGGAGGGPLSGLLQLLSGRQFAEGGIVPAGYPNDTYLARLSSGEAVIPLNKLNQYSGGGAANITGTLRLEGNDLVAAVTRNEYNLTRIGGR